MTSSVIPKDATLSELVEEIEYAANEMRESKEHMNSYEHGYDTGYWEGLRWAQRCLRGELG